MLFIRCIYAVYLYLDMLFHRYQKWITNAITVAYWLWHGVKLFMIFMLNIFMSTMRKGLGDM